MQRDPYKYFRIEAAELLEQLGQGALALDRGAPGADGVPKLLRLAHTLKGAARVVKQIGIAELAHAIEDGLVPWRDAAQRVPAADVQALIGQLDGIGAQLALLAAAPAPAPASASMPADGAAAVPGTDGAALRVLRTELAEIEALRTGIQQTHAQVSALQRGAADAAQARELALALVAQLGSSGNGGPAVRSGAAGAGAALALAEQLHALLRGGTRVLQGAAEQLDRGLRQLRDGAEQLRLVPAQVMFPALERCARDSALLLGKQVQFEAHGGDIRLDADLVAGAQGALVQLVRNAVAHGIEPPIQRRAVGKPEAGRVQVSIERHGAHVRLACRDDGAGLDLDAVRRAARERGLVPAPGEATPQALVELLLRGGLSTAGRLSEVAGRGVGLDVVREAAQRLGGEVTLHGDPGQGCTAALRLPLSLAALDVLQLECAGRVLQLPFDAVRAARRVQPQELGRAPQGDCIVHGQQPIAFARLDALLDLQAPANVAGAAQAAGGPQTALVIEAGGAFAALGVDRLLGVVRCVLQPLPAPLPADALVAGASLDLEGRPLLVLDAAGLVAAAQRLPAAAPAPAAPPRAPLLVVDDSLTTRMLEQSILETAGYEVHTAASAEDGLAQARQRDYALFVVDVDMPGMDGFGFIETTRADPRLREVPAMLVSSRASAEDKRRGAQAGARAYVVKSDFAQDQFLRHVRELVGER